MKNITGWRSYPSIQKVIDTEGKLKVGDPMLDDTDMGPLVNQQGLNNIESIVNEAVKEGAELLTGAERIKSK
jgi:acyl-CoA reductase-like NAD-dependent aldehyde dehydrogenase